MTVINRSFPYAHLIEQACCPFAQLFFIHHHGSRFTGDGAFAIAAAETHKRDIAGYGDGR